MLIIIYSFKPKAGREVELIKLWKKITTSLRNNCNSLGSRLHKASDSEYIAYAQWPNEDTYERAKLFEELDSLRSKFKDVINSMEVLHKAEIVEDLLVSNSEKKTLF